MVDIGDWKTFQAVCTRPKSVYRGQTAYCPKILPSLFRGPLPANYNGLGSAAAALYLQAYRAEERHAQIMQEEGAPLELYDDELGPYGTPPSPFSGHGFGSIGQYDEYGPMISNFLGSDEGYRHAVLQHYGAPTP